ncbi:HlyD family efflux transporter periplasmic adaptor subunit [Variovorax humicola]|uniref:HlyD family efflux transporter periplasmic adaptor subunit n=1 Tax=Variovorax humicola TaxID=1769758 RepID=A0ABU8VWD7_9BURK
MSAESYYGMEGQPRPARGTRWALRVGMLGLGVLLVWASVSHINQVTRAAGQIIASARTQVVQASDAGVLTALHVKEGDVVKAGQLLATLEKARAQAAVDDSSAKVAALNITLTRLRAEVYGKPLAFAPELLQYKEYISNQSELYQKRKTAIDQDVASLQRSLKLGRDELRMYQSLEKSGDVSRADILRLQRQVAETEAQIVNKRNKYFQDAQADMTKAQEDLNTQTEQLRDRSQVLEHTELTSPLDGIVKNIRVTTLGGVVRPGDIVLEVLPTDSDLIAEAKISPADIAFIRVGDLALVKLDAYDYSIFGSMTGEVSYISADTLIEDTRQGPQPFYRVQVRIKGHEFKTQKGHQEIQVRPGMTASVEIKAMERTVLSYLTKPVSKTITQSMGER